MEEEIEKIDEIDKNINKSKKKFKIFGISLWRIIAYFIIYSVIGYIIETLYAIITEGKLESRQNFLYGPFCSIYGVGAIIMIVSLQYFKKNNYTLFFGGFLIGSITEYAISFLGEEIFHVIWWDYSTMPLNINGRICVFFSLFWGLLSIYLLSYVNPKIDKFIAWIEEKIKMRRLKVITVLLSIFLIINFFVTSFALEMFYIRMIHNNNIQVESKKKIDEKYNAIYSNETLKDIIQTLFDDRKMITTFPNLKTIDKYGNILYFDSYLPDIQPYYYKFDASWKRKLVSMFKSEFSEENIENIGNIVNIKQ